MIVCFPGARQKSYFTKAESTSAWDGEAPVKLHHIMSGRRFDEETRNLQHTKNQHHAHREKFNEVREMLQALNENMKKCHAILDLLLGRINEYLHQQMETFWACSRAKEASSNKE